MSGLLALKGGFAYGPVSSRRLGRSLGINALPPGCKTCSFDCAYCQYGWTNPAAAFSRADFPTVAAVLAAVEDALAQLDEPPAYLTFSGHGEPTLHPELGALVDGVIALRDRLVPQTRTAILSNSSRVHDPAVRAALVRLDQRIMKLDAGTESTFRRFNRPVEGVTLDATVTGLRQLADVTIQSLFAAGPDGNTEPAEIDAWVGRVITIAPQAVQIYTLARGYPSHAIAPATPELLTEIAARVKARGIPAREFYSAP
jgi:wyosine [tRNA(Phe)-imidazoG37] synthetase (radical SAM superfamily)